MSAKMEYSGNDIAEAIKNACEKLNVPQEQLDIEVKHTGSAGIFGLCRRKATILVSLKGAETAPEPAAKGKQKPKAKPKSEAKPKEEPTVAAPAPAPEAAPPVESAPEPAKASKPAKPAKAAKPKAPRPAAPAKEEAPPTPVSDEAMATVQGDLERMLELMGYPSSVSVTQEHGKLHLHIGGDAVEDIVGPAGQTLDAIQYLLRKIASKKLSEKIHLNLDAGDFRETRLQELEETALRLAAEVKESGKTQSIPALNPAERRIVHMTLQNDTTIRSRSVGEGLFKKVLIYLPGKGRKRGGKGTRPPKSGSKQENQE